MQMSVANGQRAANGQPGISSLNEGTVPSLREEIPGCPFAARCPFATDICTRQMPVFEEKEPGHYAACFHSDEVARA